MESLKIEFEYHMRNKFSFLPLQFPLHVIVAFMTIPLKTTPFQYTKRTPLDRQKLGNQIFHETFLGTNLAAGPCDLVDT